MLESAIEEVALRSECVINYVPADPSHDEQQDLASWMGLCELGRLKFERFETSHQFEFVLVLQYLYVVHLQLGEQPLCCLDLTLQLQLMVVLRDRTLTQARLVLLC